VKFGSQEGIGSAFYFSLPLAVKIKERSRKRTEFKNENCAQKKIKNADCR
jgi:hypothetical protein